MSKVGEFWITMTIVLMTISLVWLAIVVGSLENKVQENRDVIEAQTEILQLLSEKGKKDGKV